MLTEADGGEEKGRRPFLLVHKYLTELFNVTKLLKAKLINVK